MKLPLSVCGEMASDPQSVILLLGMGVRKLSMSSAQVPRMKLLVSMLKAEDTCQLFLEAREADSSEEIRQITSGYLSKLGYPGFKP